MLAIQLGAVQINFGFDTPLSPHVRRIREGLRRFILVLSHAHPCMKAMAAMIDNGACAHGLSHRGFIGQASIVMHCSRMHDVCPAVAPYHYFAIEVAQRSCAIVRLTLFVFDCVGVAVAVSFGFVSTCVNY